MAAFLPKYYTAPELINRRTLSIPKSTPTSLAKGRKHSTATWKGKRAVNVMKRLGF